MSENNTDQLLSKRTLRDTEDDSQEHIAGNLDLDDSKFVEKYEELITRVVKHQIPPYECRRMRYHEKLTDGQHATWKEVSNIVRSWLTTHVAVNFSLTSKNEILSFVKDEFGSELTK